MSADAAPTCPQRESPLRAGSMVLCHREDDDRRTCRMVWGCSNEHVWWKWADRPRAPLEPCPYPDLLDG
ncbi:dehydrogenase [Streptomyces sp. NPDC001970]